MPTPEPKTHRRGTSVLFAVLALAVVAAVVAVAVAFVGSGSDDRALQIADDPSARRTTTTTSTSVAGTTTTPSTVTTPTTSAPTTTGRPPETTPPAPTTPPPTEPPAGPVSQSFTIPARTARMCDEARVTVHFAPEPGEVIIRDDSGREVGGWKGRSGENHRVDLPHPTRLLHVTVTAVGDHIRSSGSATADAC